MRAAAIDIGTNSLLLTVGERQPTGDVSAIHEEATITRLGEGVATRGSLSPAAIERSLVVLRDYAEKVIKLGAGPRGVVGTSALRDATNRADFLEMAEDAIGAPVEIITGRREAELCLRGVQGTRKNFEKRTLIFDIGGGSTEFILSAPGTGQSIEALTSLDIGTVRLTERHVCNNPPGKTELEQIRAEINQALAEIAQRFAGPSRLIGVAGTVTTLAAIAMKLGVYDGERINGYELSAEEVGRQVGCLSRMSLEQRRAIPGLHPKRADVIVAGALLVEAILAHFKVASCSVSDRGVRWGLLYTLLDQR